LHDQLVIVRADQLRIADALTRRPSLEVGFAAPRQEAPRIAQVDAHAPPTVTFETITSITMADTPAMDYTARVHLD